MENKLINKIKLGTHHFKVLKDEGDTIVSEFDGNNGKRIISVGYAYNITDETNLNQEKFNEIEEQLKKKVIDLFDEEKYERPNIRIVLYKISGWDGQYTNIKGFIEIALVGDIDGNCFWLLK